MSTAQSVAGSLASSGASSVAGSGGGVVPVVNRFAQFAGAVDEAIIPATSHTAAAGTVMVRCKLDVATPAALAQSGLISWNNTATGSTHYPFTSGVCYNSIFRLNRAGPITLSASITRTTWHWFITRDDAANGWEMLQAKDDGTLYSVSTAAHEAWVTAIFARNIGKNSGGNYFDGGMDRFLVGDSRWSDAQIQAVIAGGNGPVDTLIRFELDEISGGKFLDSSGNGKHATISGSPVITDF